MSRRRGRSGRPAGRNKLIEIVVTLAFLALLIAVILPWAGQGLAAGFGSIIEQSR